MYVNFTPGSLQRRTRMSAQQGTQCLNLCFLLKCHTYNNASEAMFLDSQQPHLSFSTVSAGSPPLCPGLITFVSAGFSVTLFSKILPIKNFAALSIPIFSFALVSNLQQRHSMNPTEPNHPTKLCSLQYWSIWDALFTKPSFAISIC